MKRGPEREDDSGEEEASDVSGDEGLVDDSADEEEQEELGDESDVDDEDIDEHDSLDGSGEDEEDESEEDEVPNVTDTDDSSDDETMVNTVGNIPMKWYEHEDHIGYDLEGNKIARPATVDQIQDFVNKADNPEYWRSVFDELNQKNVVLTDEELRTINRIRAGGFAHSDKFDPFQMPATMVVDPQDMAMAMSSTGKPKNSFIPSKWEAEKVRKMVKAIREGRFSKRAVPSAPAMNYLIWDDDMSEHKTRRGGAALLQKQHIPAPKPALPGHNESYNPSEEYLPTEQERTEWENLEEDEREAAWLPTKFKSLRQVPAYHNFIREAFNRCLDLYLCPRVRRMRHNISSDALIPKLPNPKQLEPFPKQLQTMYEGHTARIRSLSFDPAGEWMASCADDHTIRIWEVDTGRCVRKLLLGEDNQATQVAWCPAASQVPLLLAAVGSAVWLIDPGTGGRGATGTLPGSDVPPESDVAGVWDKPSSHLLAQVKGIKNVLRMPATVKHISWHAKGDYFSTVCPDAVGQPVVVHQLSKRKSRIILKKSKGSKVQKAQFHPTKPYFYIATQQYIRVYNLIKMELKQKLMPGVRYISSFEVHPGGENVLVGSYDRRVCWIDTELSTRPFKILRNHTEAVRQVAYHRRYPLFASAADDCLVHVFHGMVYNDFQNPLLVPVKILRGHTQKNDLGILDLKWHPIQPWLATAGADHTLRLFVP